MRKFSGVGEIVDDIPPDEPLHIFREHTLEKAANFFNTRFKGRVCYAVKTNPQPHILQKVYETGITSFDVASIAEVELVKNLLPNADLYFMHTVKSRAAIKKAYYEYGVRSFSLDTVEELEKILGETNFAKDLNLFVRLAIPNTYSELTLADKFGINSKEAPALLKKARQFAKKLGICFHVGSQCMHPDAYRIAIRTARSVVTKSGVLIDCLDVGGGFPSVYPGMIPPQMESYFIAIDEEFKKFKDYRSIELMCEPGRAIVAESGSVLVKVDLRKDSLLYINDGTYGSLFDAGTPHFIFPVRLIRPNGNPYAENLLPFSFFGPTCDTLDFMKGPFYLPEDVQEGDYIEIGQLGAYGRSLATAFNGFKPADEIVVTEDEPLMTMYEEDISIQNQIDILAA
ncbi:MAG TPA: ornithine decarboxylase [Alphaproteobacteria bacterium]|nr:ornithine decarboxylase [Alphaproteobacteria bacterium]